MKTAFKILVLSAFIMTCSYSFAQVEDEYTDSYTFFAGFNFKGENNYNSVAFEKDRMYPLYKDYKFSGYGLSFDYYNKSNLFLAGKFFIKPLPCCFLRNPYVFSILELQAGYFSLSNQSGMFIRPQLSMFVNSSTEGKLVVRFKIGYGYDLVLPKPENIDFSENSLILQLGLAYRIYTKPERELRFDD